MTDHDAAEVQGTRTALRRAVDRVSPTLTTINVVGTVVVEVDHPEVQVIPTCEDWLNTVFTPARLRGTTHRQLKLHTATALQHPLPTAEHRLAEATVVTVEVQRKAATVTEEVAVHMLLHHQMRMVDPRHRPLRADTGDMAEDQHTHLHLTIPTVRPHPTLTAHHHRAILMRRRLLQILMGGIIGTAAAAEAGTGTEGTVNKGKGLISDSSGVEL